MERFATVTLFSLLIFITIASLSSHSNADCQPSGTLACGSQSYPTYSCSPPVTTSTQAILTNNDFSQGGDGGAPSECDSSFHSSSELIVALSTGWYSGGSRCGTMMEITSTKTGQSVTAKVVDECDSMNGCDAEHAGLPPCRNNIVDASSAVWNALGLNVDVDCQPSGTLTCGSQSYPTYSCSPPVMTSTQAILTNNDFSEGGDGGAESECDGSFHSNSELIVALSTGWYSGGSRCGQMIKITSIKTGLSVTAKVVDECDSMNGCDAEHAGLPPCRNNIVDGSDAVWNALGLDINVGEEAITWSTA